jgi:SAM-dependent methyltransferase
VDAVKNAGKRAFWRFNWLARHQLVGALERVRVHARGLLLDVGCGSMPFAPVLQPAVEHYVGVDLPASRDLGRAGTRQPDVFARAEALPFRDASADTVFAFSLLTYVFEPSRFLDEAARVLRPGGVAILEFTQMTPLHPWLPDYLRFTRTGAERLLESAGFEILQVEPVGGLMSRVGLSWIGALNRINRGPTRLLTEIPVRFLYVALQLGFAGLDRLTRDPREPLTHVIAARRRA